MQWLARTPERRLNPELVLPGVRSVVIVALNYWQPAPPRRGIIATYALGEDYHEIMEPRLRELAGVLERMGGQQKIYVDTGPVLERAYAASISWQGKSTMAIHPKMGTWFFLGTILTTLPLEPDAPVHDHCGSCTRCIRACPTRAITAPYQLDARLCISYLTIEHKGHIPVELRRAVGDHLFGCDDCLSVCPWNRWAREGREARLAARELPDLRDMLAWERDDFRRHMKGTPIERLKLPRWKRNICVVLGNIGTNDDLSILDVASRDEDQMIAEHARWAVSEINHRHKEPIS